MRVSTTGIVLLIASSVGHEFDSFTAFRAPAKTSPVLHPFKSHTSPRYNGHTMTSDAPSAPAQISEFAKLSSFVWAMFTNPRQTGSLFPSSPALARSMAADIPNRPQMPYHVIELGPGTGPFTGVIYQQLGLDAPSESASRLTLVEYNGGFAKALKREFPRADVVQGDAYALKNTLSDVKEGTVDAVPSRSTRNIP